MNTATRSIEREGAKVRRHISEVTPQECSPVFVTFISHKNEFLKIFPACIGFLLGGTAYPETSPRNSREMPANMFRRIARWGLKGGDGNVEEELDEFQTPQPLLVSEK